MCQQFSFWPWTFDTALGGRATAGVMGQRGSKAFDVSSVLTLPDVAFSSLLQTEPFQQWVQGRRIGPEELALIAGWLQAHPTWNRTRLSRELCGRWSWRNHAGRLKDMACRTLLLKLEAQGWIVLPPRRTASVNGRRNQSFPELAHDQSPIQCALQARGDATAFGVDDICAPSPRVEPSRGRGATVQPMGWILQSLWDWCR